MDQAEFRQWAMIHALQGLLANPAYVKAILNSPKAIVSNAVQFADALLEANTIDLSVEDGTAQ